MNKKNLLKDSFRNIKNSFTSFILIIIMLSLGSMVFIGMKLSSPNLRFSLDEMFFDQNAYDIKITSYQNLKAKDYKLLKDHKHTDILTKIYQKDILIDDSKDIVIRLNSFDKEINKPIITEGKYKKGEILIDEEFKKSGKKIGDTITLNSKNLRKKQYKISGFFKSIEYINPDQKGSTNIGDSKLDYFALIDKDEFINLDYNCLLVKFDNTKNLNITDEKYASILTKNKNKLEGTYEKRANERYKNTVDKANDKIDKGLNELKDSKISLEDQKKKLDDSLKSPLLDENLKKDIYKNKDKINKALKEIDNEKNKLEDQRKDIDKLKPVNYKIESILDNQFISIYKQSAINIDQLSFIFPTIFYLIALMLSLTSFTRMIDKDRTQIGIYKALGYSNIDISKKYLIFGLLTSIFSLIIGTLLGYKIIMPVIFNAYYSQSIFDNIPMIFEIKYMIISMILNLFVTVFASFIAVNKELREKTAQLLKPKPPKKAKKVLLENIKPIWNHLGFFNKVSYRNIFRYKKRLFMTIFGVTGCTALITMGFGLRDSVLNINQKEFSDIIHYDTIAIFNENDTKENLDKYNEFIKNNEHIKKYIKIRYENVSFKNKSGHIEDASIFVAKKLNNFNDFISLKDRKTGQKLKTKDIVISETLKRASGVDINESLKVKSTEGENANIKMKNISENYFGHFVYLNKKSFEKIFEDKKENAYLLITDNNKNLENQLNALKASVSAISINRETDVMNKLIDSLNIVVFVIVVISCLLAFVVLYNLTTINVEERKREISTIKVLGFFSKEVTIYLYRETIVISIFSILLGFLLGKILHGLVILIVAPSIIMLDPHVNIKTYLIAFLLTMSFSLIVMAIIDHKLKKINMVESLKSPE